MNKNKMVIRFKDRTLMKGKSADFLPLNQLFHFKDLSGNVVMVDMETLKAIFFVKSFQGNKKYSYNYQNIIPWGSNRMKVDFIDGESMIGYAQHYNCLRHHVYFSRYGFFISPADFKGNNDQVFVLNSAIEKISFLQNSLTDLITKQKPMMFKLESDMNRQWPE
jgi:hypothetical protein